MRCVTFATVQPTSAHVVLHGLPGSGSCALPSLCLSELGSTDPASMDLGLIFVVVGCHCCSRNTDTRHVPCCRDTDRTTAQPQAITGRSPGAVHGLPANDPAGSGFRRGRLLPGFPGRFSVHRQTRALSRCSISQPAQERRISAITPAVCSRLLARRSAPDRERVGSRQPNSSRSWCATQPECEVCACKDGVGSGGVAWPATDGCGGAEGSRHTAQ